MLTNMTELFDSELREARRLYIFCRKQGMFRGGNAFSGVWSESGTTADRIVRIEESAKHRVSDSLSGLLRCTCSCYFSHSVFLRRLHLS